MKALGLVFGVDCISTLSHLSSHLTDLDVFLNFHLDALCGLASSEPTWRLKH